MHNKCSTDAKHELQYIVGYKNRDLVDEHRLPEVRQTVFGMLPLRLDDYVRENPSSVWLCGGPGRPSIPCGHTKYKLNGAFISPSEAVRHSALVG